MPMTIKEQVLKYPRAWEKEYRRTRFVGVWRRAYPRMFTDHRGSANFGTLDLFAQYALMYLLRRKERFHSLTWYKLAGNKDLSRIRLQIQQRWDKMRVVMGSTGFARLQTALRRRGFRGFKGEPDLFCWNPKTGSWFFAEAKGRDRLTQSEQHWHRVGESVFGSQRFRVYRPKPK